MIQMSTLKATQEDMHEILITTAPSGRHYWRDFWHFRELLILLVWRDILVRYKQTVIGLSWSILRPLTMMLAFTLVFSKFARLPSNETPYALLVFAGLLPWMFFANTFSEAANSIVSNGHIISKIYFPRLIIPVSSLLVGLVDFAIAGGLYLVLSLLYERLPDWHVVFLPLFALMLCLLILALSLWAAALTVKYRDFRYIVPVMIQLGTYVSPVGFSSSVVPDRWQLLYALNPMVGIINGFRWSLLGGKNELQWEPIAISLLITLLLLIPGIRFFRRTENGFADEI